MLLQKFKILGHSMEPTFINGSEVLVSSISYFFSKPKQEDIVVFKYLNKILIKKIKKIKSNSYFLEGDNIKDSLNVGWILRKDIIGKVIYKL